MPPAELYMYIGMYSRMGCGMPRAGMQGAGAAASCVPHWCAHECGALHQVRCAGGFEEATRRRKEAELSRAQLQQKIESLKQARNSTPRTGACLTWPTPPAPNHTAAIPLSPHLAGSVLKMYCAKINQLTRQRPAGYT